MQDSNQIINEVTEGDYKYGFVTHIDTDVIHRGLDEETVNALLAKEQQRVLIRLKRLENCIGLQPL